MEKTQMGLAFQFLPVRPHMLHVELINIQENY